MAIESTYNIVMFRDKFNTDFKFRPKEDKILGTKIPKSKLEQSLLRLAKKNEVLTTCLYFTKN